MDLWWRSEWFGLLEFSTLGSNVWLGVGSWSTWRWTEMLKWFSVLWSSEEKCVGSCWSSHDQLIKSHASSSGLNNSSSSGLSESQSCNSHLWYFKKSNVISNWSNYDSDSLSFSFQKLLDLWDRNRWSIDSRRDKSSQNSLWKSWSSSSCEESEKLDEKMNIKIGASCILLVRILNSTSFN